MTGSLEWARVRPILERAIDLPGAERAAYLDRACAGDSELRRRAERLIESELVDESFLVPPASAPDDDGVVPGAARSGDRVGAYRLVERIGRGGMGEVWSADRVGAGFDQRVALKLIRLGMHTDDVLARFRDERQTLAQLVHPYIPRLLDGGATDDGRPYFVLDFVDGVPIDRHVADQRATLDERVALVRKLCDAVAHAHAAGVVHRDIKAANVLVDANGDPRLLDFGIAKVVHGDGDVVAAGSTATNLRVMTPRSASPEQVLGRPITTATDVHALGLLLWELLVGAPARPTDPLSARELEEVVCIDEIPRPSSAARDGTLRRALRGDLDRIVGMALRKEPDRRYASARELADDLRRYAEGYPVRARHESRSYRARKFVRRNRAVVLGAAATLVALCAAIVAIAREYRTSEQARLESRHATYVSRLQAAEASLRAGHGPAAAAHLDAAPVELRGWVWRCLHARTRASLWESPPDPGLTDSHRVGWSGSNVVHTRWNGVISREDSLARHIGSGVEPVRCAVHPATRTVAWSTEADVWIAPEGGTGQARPLGGGGPDAAHVNDLAWSDDGARLAVSRADGSVTVHDASDGRVTVRFHQHGASERGGRMSWHPDGRTLASGGWDETIQLYDTVTGEPLGGWRAHTMCVEDLDFDASGSRLVSCSMDASMKLWDIGSRRLVATLLPHDRAINCVRFTPDGAHLLSADHGGALRLVHIESEAVVTQYPGHGFGVTDISIHPSGDTFASVDFRAAMRTWRIADRDLRFVLGCEYSKSVVASPDGRYVAVGSPDGRVRVWELAGLRLVRDLDVAQGLSPVVAWSADGARLFAVHGPRFVVLDAEGFEVAMDLNRPDDYFVGVDVDPAGDGVVVYGRSLDDVDGGRLWSWSGSDPGSLEERGPCPSPSDYMPWVRRRDGTFLVTSSDLPDGHVAIVDPSEGSTRPERTIPFVPDALPECVTSLSANDREATVVNGRRIVVFDVDSLRVRASWSTDETIYCAALHPDGECVALAIGEQIEIWDPAVPALEVSLRGHRGWVGALEWTSDGETLLAAGSDGRVVLWETR